MKLTRHPSTWILILIFSIAVFCPDPGYCDLKKKKGGLIHLDTSYNGLSQDSVSQFTSSLMPSQTDPVKSIEIVEPLPETLLPCDMASTAFLWKDETESSGWLLTVKDENKTIVTALLDKSWWIPEKKIWEAIKVKSNQRLLTVRIQGIGGWSGREILSDGITRFKFSKDALNARIMFMRKPIPFRAAKSHPDQTQLLVGDIRSYERPVSVMSDINTCANCHSYSLDGKKFAMDVDYGGDKGGFAMARIKPSMDLQQKDFFSWNTLPARAPSTYSMGLFAQLSPRGRYIAGTVNETSVFVMMDDLYFSQLFFPASGQLGIFDQKLDKYFLLPGADKLSRTQTTPAWSPDEKTIAFACTTVNPDYLQKIKEDKIVAETPDQNIESLNKKYPVQFDIFTIAFNNGAGGESRPLKGASKNGASNYFPRYSPDGNWIAFTQSPTGLVLQPDSRICIVPAAGGRTRQLECNLPVMNSWHSWSPNSRWLVFTCKAVSPYTQLYLTHINQDGSSSPAVRLFRFSHTQFAAMVPEFLPADVALPEMIAFQLPKEKQNMATDGR